MRIKANDPISTIVHQTQKFRCNLCGVIFEYIPENVLNSKKYDETVMAHIIMHKCFYGIAYNRSASFGPLGTSVRAELFAQADSLLAPIVNVLIKYFANSDQISFDDTKIKIQPLKKGGSKTGWASVFVGRDCVLYFLDRNHAGIVLENILKERILALEDPLALSDALPAYEPYKKNCIDLHCLTHARRRFIDSKEDDEEFCNEIIAQIGKIYTIDDQAKKSDDLGRLNIHHSQSVPILNEIMDTLQNAVEDKKFLPNCELSKGITYWLKNFNKITEFTRTSGVLLDTNHVERGVKAPIRIRKQAPIFKTEEGAKRVGRMLTLVETSRKIEVNPSHYLTWALNGVIANKAPIELTPWMFKRYLEKEKSFQSSNFEREGPLIE